MYTHVPANKPANARIAINGDCESLARVEVPKQTNTHKADTRFSRSIEFRHATM
jgi:hypothetical protein